VNSLNLNRRRNIHFPIHQSEGNFPFGEFLEPMCEIFPVPCELSEGIACTISIGVVALAVKDETVDSVN
jgi:hypothetical protein